MYVRRQSTEAGRAIASDILNSHCLDTLQAPYTPCIQPIQESVPVGFSLTISKYCKNSRSAAFEREIALLKRIRAASDSTEVLRPQIIASLAWDKIKFAIEYTWMHHLKVGSKVLSLTNEGWYAGHEY